jgi:hypothetical protein
MSELPKVPLEVFYIRLPQYVLGGNCYGSRILLECMKVYLHLIGRSTGLTITHGNI